MKAAIYPAYGPPESLVMADIAIPSPKDGEALVRVNYAGINPIDWKIGEGRLKAYIDCSFPLVVGRDISGVIADTNNNDRFAMGDKVVAALPGPGSGLAEYVAVPVDYLALAPKNASLEESASIPLVGLTCWQGLIEFAELSKGQVVFIL
jgi:NADPH:quinone reductase-like Zn-dependent oxidoreductase